MSQGTTPPGIPPTSALSGDARDEPPKSIFLVSYPKVVFFYPTLIAAFVAGIYTAIAQNPDRWDTHAFELLFMAVFTVNLVIFAFDFPRTTSLTLFFFLAAVVLGTLLFFSFNKDILPFVHEVLNAYRPHANTTFYFSIAGILSLIFAAVIINVQFDYWEVTSNELLHHHGFLSNLERFSAPNLKVDKEINDVFEYALLHAGRLILHPSNEPRAIVLENVLRINSREAELTKMLGTLQVQIRSGAPA
jgi:hypothetical protein